MLLENPNQHENSRKNFTLPVSENQCQVVSISPFSETGGKSYMIYVPLTYLKEKKKSSSFKSIKLVTIKLPTTLSVHSKFQSIGSYWSVNVFQLTFLRFWFPLKFHHWWVRNPTQSGDWIYNCQPENISTG